MRLADFQLGTPLLRLEVRIHYSSPRQSTALERVMLQLCDRFAKNSEYSTVPISVLFEQFLGVDDPEPIISPTLNELIRLDVVSAAPQLKTVDRLPTLGELDITDRGRQMLATSQLPGAAQYVDEIFYFDPVANQLLSEAATRGNSDTPPAASLDPLRFGLMLPDHLIRARVARGKFPWWTPSTRIEKMERLGDPQVTWKARPATVEIEGETVTVQAPGEYGAYLHGLAPEELVSCVLRPVLMPTEIGTLEIAGDIGERFQEPPPGQWATVPEALRLVAGDSSIVLTRTNSPLNFNADSDQANGVVVHFHDDMPEGNVQVRWNEFCTACSLAVAGPFPVKHAWIATPSVVVSVVYRHLKVGAERYELPIAVVDRSDESTRPVRAVLMTIAERLRTMAVGDPSLLAIPSIWLDERCYWCEYVMPAMDQIGSGQDKPSLLKEISLRVRAITGKPLSTAFEQVIARTMETTIPSDTSLTQDQLKSFVDLIVASDIRDENALAHLSVIIVKQCPVPNSTAEYAATAGAIIQKDSPLIIPFPSPLHVDVVVKQMLDDIAGEAVPAYLHPRNPFDCALLRFREAECALNEVVASNGFRALTVESYDALLRSSKVVSVKKAISDCKDAIDEIERLLQGREKCISGSHVSIVKQQIQEFSNEPESTLDAEAPVPRRVYVIDTNVLISDPDVLRRFNSDELIVVTKRVLEELDDKKCDESVRPAISKVARLLRGFPKERIEYCDSDLSVLSKDYREKGDNRILSVAVKYKNRAPVLLTNDNLLATKAIGEGITAIGSAEFARSRLQR